MPDVPAGTVTFLFTDIEGSTLLLRRLGDRRYAEVLAQHQRLLREAFAHGGGREVDTQGDAFFVAFHSATDAVATAVAVQQALAIHPWPDGVSLRVRMGLHTGVPVGGEGRYVGVGVHRAARICQIGHGGQVLLSQTTADMVEGDLPEGVSLRNLGEHRLKDVAHPERIFQLAIPDLPAEFPHLTSMSRKTTTLQWAVLAIAISVAGLAIGRVYLTRRAPGINSVAVLPFQNLSADPEQEYFADGMTDALITTLGQLGALRVISRTSIMVYKDARKPLPEVAKALGVDAVVEGAVLQSGGRVRVTAQLIRAPTDQHLWARSYERDLRDIITLQNEVARAIAQEIKLKLTSQQKAQLAASRTVDPEAYQAYLKGRYAFNKFTEEGERTAIRFYGQAIARDPQFAAAYAGLGWAYDVLAGPGIQAVPPKEGMPKGKAAALKALELDPALADAHALLGDVAFYFDWDLVTAEREYKKAIELNPNDALLQTWYAQFLNGVGHHQESLKVIRRAQELDPLSPFIKANVMWRLVILEQYDELFRLAKETLELDPEFWVAYWSVGGAYERTGKYEECVTAQQKAVEHSGGNADALADLGGCYALAGRHDEALKIIEQLKAPGGAYSDPFRIARVYVALGDTDRAFEWLEKALQVRSGWMILLEHERWTFASLKSDPRFAELLKKMNVRRS